MKIINILVTGGAGFIGSHLCEKLVEKPFTKIFSLDNYFTGKLENHIENVTYLKGSTMNIEEIIKFKPDYIYHLGEYSRVEQSYEEIKTVWEYNIKGTFAVLEFVRKNNAKLIYVSSSTKFSENGLGKELSPYTWAKFSNTELIVNYSKWYGIKFAIAYFYNVYGGREISKGKYATIMGIYKTKFKNNEDLPVVKPGTQKRNFTHINDIIDGLILVGEKGLGDNFAIGNHKSYSIIEVAKMFGNKISWLKKRKGNREDSCIDTSKMEKLGWFVKIDLKDHINRIKNSTEQ